MIGMSCKNARRAVELFGQHRARQQVRPGRAAEGEQQVRLPALGLAMPVGGTDQETRLANPAIAPLAENFGKLFGGKIGPFLVERDGAVRILGRRDLAAGVGQFGQFRIPRDPCQIAILPRATIWRSMRAQQPGSGIAPGSDLAVLAKGPHPLDIVEAAHFGAE